MFISIELHKFTFHSMIVTEFHCSESDYEYHPISSDK